MTRASWTSAFLDLAPADLAAGTAFWAAVTGYDATPVSDLSREFPPLRPPSGSPYLWVQRVGDAPSRVHVDLHVSELAPAVRQAESLGAEVVDRPDHVVLRSPGGLPFCLVEDQGDDVPPPALWPPGYSSRVDRVRLLVPASAHAEEVALWEAIQPSRAVALDLVVEVGGEEVSRAVLEVGTTDRHREAIRHTALGAAVVDSTPTHDDAVDPCGIPYRIADRTH